MPLEYVNVATRICKPEIILALTKLTLENADFDHRKWSLWEAEDLEQIAKMIRDGYAGGAK